MTPPIRWSIHLRSSPERVFELLSTDAGRATFWAEDAVERDGAIHFRFASGDAWSSRVLESDAPRRFAIEYINGSRAQFDLERDDAGGTVLALTETGVPESEWNENHAGWVSLLLTLKAAADHGVDLRNHDARRTWAAGFVDV